MTVPNRTDAVLASIDGALADEQWPDAMRWSADPASVTDASGYAYGSEDDAPSPWRTFLEEYDPQAAAVAFARVDVPDPRLCAVVGPAMTRVRTVHEDDGSLTLILEPDTERLEAAFRGFAEAVRPAMERLGEAFGMAAEAAGRAFEGLRPLLEDLRLIRDEGPDPVEQPFERALWHKARQGTGPDRQVQHRPRPRRHRL